MSPFVFTGNNPIMLVDPNGMEVWLIGNLAELALSELQKTTSCIVLNRDQETGKLSYKQRDGVELDDAAKRIVNAIDDSNANVNLVATDDSYTSDESMLMRGLLWVESKTLRQGKLALGIF